MPSRFHEILGQLETFLQEKKLIQDQMQGEGLNAHRIYFEPTGVARSVVLYKQEKTNKTQLLCKKLFTKAIPMKLLLLYKKFQK